MATTSEQSFDDLLIVKNEIIEDVLCSSRIDNTSKTIKASIKHEIDDNNSMQFDELSESFDLSSVITKEEYTLSYRDEVHQCIDDGFEDCDGSEDQLVNVEDTDFKQSNNTVSVAGKSKRKNKQSRTYQCIDCKQKISNVMHLKTHIKNDHSIGHKCNVCLKIYQYKSKLSIHLRRHTNDLYICQEPGCDKKFFNKYRLDLHCVTHTGTNPFACNYPGCTKEFTNNHDFNRHNRIHSGEKPYVCDESGCNKRFNQIGHLTEHRRIHANVRPFACDHRGCGKKFNRKRHLDQHQRIHTGEYSFKCDHPGCNKKFIQKQGLNIHKLSHTNEKPYACTESKCGKSFKHIIYLNMHKKFHTGQSSFDCVELGCEKRFATKRELTVHKRFHLKETSEPSRC